MVPTLSTLSTRWFPCLDTDDLGFLKLLQKNLQQQKLNYIGKLNVHRLASVIFFCKKKNKVLRIIFHIQHLNVQVYSTYST